MFDQKGKITAVDRNFFFVRFTKSLEKSPMEIFYATFGQGHEHHDRYCEIVTEDKAAAQKIMSSYYGRDWAMLYDSPEEAGTAKFGLRFLIRLS